MVAVMVESQSAGRSDTEWLLLKVALPAATDFGELMTVLVEAWPAASQDRLSWVDLATDSKKALSKAVGYGDSMRREATLEGANIGQLQVLRYDEERPGDKTKQAFHIAECVIVNLRCHLADAELQQVSVAQRAAQQLIVLLNDQFGVEDGYLRRQDALSLCPSPPLAPADVLLQMVRRDHVEAQYDSELYWSSWDQQIALRDGKVLVSRAVDVASGADFQQAIFENQWQLARAVKTANETQYGTLLQSLGRPLPVDYLGLVDGLETTLNGFHYHAEKQILDVSAWADPGTFVTPVEVAQLLSWRINQRYDDGSPVSEVRVTFPSRQQADAQHAVLRDIGCQVHYLDEKSGSPVPLRQP